MYCFRCGFIHQGITFTMSASINIVIKIVDIKVGLFCIKKKEKKLLGLF